MKQRIVKNRIVKTSDLKEWEKNPREIDKGNYERLKKQIQRLGQYKPLLVNQDMIVLGGNMRLKVYREMGIENAWIGQVETHNEDEMLEYALSDNDRAGKYIEAELLALIRETDIDLELYKVDLGRAYALIDLLKEEEESYSKKIVPPTYEPSLVRPELHQLVDTDKAEELRSEIDQADIPAEVKNFLYLATTRHYVFNYSLIADYYAHADLSTKSLFERSALVIIDLNQAIAGGFVRLTKNLMELQKGEREE
jgi:hypothetical protein